MTDLEIFESLRPDVHPLPAHDRAAMRSELFGESAREPELEMAGGGTAQSDAVRYDLALGVRTSGAPRRGRWGTPSIAAAVIAVVGLAVVWVAVGSRSAVDEPVQSQHPVATNPGDVTSPSPPTPTATPIWYDTIQPLLPDGFDQIALITALPEVVSFKAFRTGTRQLLDITITLQPGYDVKDTGEAVTFTDEHGEYIESTSGVALTTPDERRVSVRCGLSPIGRGAVGSVGMTDSTRDYCGDGFENLDLDPASRRALAARLASDFPTQIDTPDFGQPVTSDTEEPAVAEAVAEYIGERGLFSVEHADGVLRVVNLSPSFDVPPSTELTVILGMWPPNGDGSAFDDVYDNSPQGRFYGYGDLAVALVVIDRTAYHVATTDVSQENLSQLGELLNQLTAVLTDSTVPVATAPGSTVASPADVGAPAATTPATTVPLISDAITEALRPDGRVLVVNASTTAGLAGSLSAALEHSGYDMLEPGNASNGVVLDESIIYSAPGASPSTFNAIASAVPIPRGEELLGQSTPALTAEMIDSADVIVVLGADLAHAPWDDADIPLFDPGNGRLLIIDGTTTESGHTRASALADELRAAGVNVAGIALAASPLAEMMLMPIGDATPWTYAIAELAGVGGFDTWSPDLVSDPIPEGVTAALVIADT